jgi:hypothetical protein
MSGRAPAMQKEIQRIYKNPLKVIWSYVKILPQKLQKFTSGINDLRWEVIVNFFYILVELLTITLYNKCLIGYEENYITLMDFCGLPEFFLYNRFPAWHDNTQIYISDTLSITEIITLWKESLISDGQQFYQYIKKINNHLSPQIIYTWSKFL